MISLFSIQCCEQGYRSSYWRRSEFKQCQYRANFWNRDVRWRSGWRFDGGGETSNVGRQCGDDNQLARIMDTTTKGAIPSIVREGSFAVIDGKRNPWIATINFFAIERSKEYATTRKSYTIKWAKILTTSSKGKSIPSWLRREWCYHIEQNKTIGRDE